MLSDIVNDKRVIKATKNVLRVIVRRPHAYKFKANHRQAPIPGFAVLDSNGKYLGGVRLRPLQDTYAAQCRTSQGTDARWLDH